MDALDMHTSKYMEFLLCRSDIVSAAIAQHSQTANDLYLDGTPMKTRSAEYLHVFTASTSTKHAAQILLDELDDAHRIIRLAMLVGPHASTQEED
jgi:hypothetical protein